MPKSAWVIKYTDIGDEDAFVTYMDEGKALKDLADTLVGYAREEIENIDWGEEGPPQSLTDTIAAFTAGDHKQAIAAWEDFEFTHGPVDRTGALIETTVVK